MGLCGVLSPEELQSSSLGPRRSTTQIWISLAGLFSRFLPCLEFLKPRSGVPVHTLSLIHI